MTTDDKQARATRLNWRSLISVVACLLSFAFGYWASERRLKDKAFEEGQRQVGEFLVNAIRMKVITVDHERLSELVSDQAGNEGNGTNAP